MEVKTDEGVFYRRVDPTLPRAVGERYVTGWSKQR
jgi:hypothetical protein